MGSFTLCSTFAACATSGEVASMAKNLSLTNARSGSCSEMRRRFSVEMGFMISYIRGKAPSAYAETDDLCYMRKA